MYVSLEICKQKAQESWCYVMRALNDKHTWNIGHRKGERERMEEWDIWLLSSCIKRNTQMETNLIALIPNPISRSLIGFYFAPFICRALLIFITSFRTHSISIMANQLISNNTKCGAQQQSEQEQEQWENKNMMIYAFICSIERPTQNEIWSERLSINWMCFDFESHLSTSGSVELWRSNIGEPTYSMIWCNVRSWSLDTVYVLYLMPNFTVSLVLRLFIAFVFLPFFRFLASAYERKRIHFQCIILYIPFHSGKKYPHTHTQAHYAIALVRHPKTIRINFDEQYILMSISRFSFNLLFDSHSISNSINYGINRSSSSSSTLGTCVCNL